MDFQEKADISKQFIETLTQVPVLTCQSDLPSIENGINRYLPDFIRRSFPFFLTESMVRSFEAPAVCHITDYLGLHFHLFVYDSNTKVFLAGPYLPYQADTSFCEQVLQKNHHNLSLLMPLRQFYSTLPVISSSQMLDATRTALRTVTGHEGDIPYLRYEPQSRTRPQPAKLSPEGVDEASMELLEQRYTYENLLLQEVAQGNQDKAAAYYRQFYQNSRSIVRTEDPVRTAKNLGFSLNTMLRKSAETAGIHPVYLDIISANFAMLIENSGKLQEIEDFKAQMVSAYCRFVQKHRMDQYSPLIRKAATYIHLHLADPLTLEQIAGSIRVSQSYLSRVFNREMKESLSGYIMKTRIEKAADLLAFSEMSIQNIAFYVGFGDLNYFSRCFKKCKNMTPTAYRSARIGKQTGKAAF